MDRWVWTTFNIFQWDLNYRNPDVFRDMAGEMLFLANAGRRGAAPRCAGLHLEGDGHDLREPAQGAHAGAGLQRRCCASPRRACSSSPRPSSTPTRSPRYIGAGRVPALLQPAAHGAAVEQPGHARGAPAAPLHGLPLPDSRRLRLGQLRALSRRHRLDLRRRRRRRAGHQRLRPSPLSQRLLHRALSRAALRAACPSRRTRARATRASPARWPRWPGWSRHCAAATAPRSSWPCGASCCSTPSSSASAASR